MPADKSYDSIILGAGGAGLMCASTAAQRGRRVALIEHAAEPGKKILISGGGRCNFTNLEAVPERYISANPHFAKSALRRYTAQDFIDLVNRHGIAWHEKTLGQLFCDGSARQIVDMLLDECKAGSTTGGEVTPVFGEVIKQVAHREGWFEVTTDRDTLHGRSLVIATGGPSIPKLGATGFAYDLARQFGLKIVEPRPALVPFTLSGDEALFRDLSGVSADTVVRHAKTSFREASLFTHKGLSGPAILQISSYWRHGEPIRVDFLPSRSGEWLVASKRKRPTATLHGVLGDVLPNRLAGALCERLGLDGALASLSDKALKDTERRLHDWTFHPNGTEGFAKAEVTVGGISTADLSSKTMESRKVPGLYAIGEAVDVTGWLGGYNFQWAWASGVAAGQAL